ncbi:hypothetical protein D7Y09_16110 [bacterium 1XD42-1]|nr:hypothetical protein D7X25_28225 [bacterium 1XD42-8]RKJ61271.1 hypothetical protein D7Y09_16110 [bacterium 1XD42-1]
MILKNKLVCNRPQKVGDNPLYTSEYFNLHSIENLEKQIKHLKRTCIILSVSVILFALIGIRSALQIRRMVNIVESTVERVCLICDEIEDDLNSRPQYKCDNI